jgi:hypothetical protein
VEVRTGLVWLRIGYKWRALVNAVKSLEFHKMLGNSRVATQLVDSPVVH